MTSGLSVSDRAAFHDRWEDVNDALEELAGDFTENVHFSGEIAVATFEAQHVGFDCFHPSAAGQKLLSDTSWHPNLFDPTR